MLCLDMATSVSQTLNETREVIYGETREVVYGDFDNVGKFSMEHLGQLMTKMDSRLSHIEIFVKKIDEVQFSLKSITSKINTLEADVKKIENFNKDLEGSVQGMSNLYDVVKQSCDKNKNDITQVKSSFTSIVNDNKSIRDEIESLRKDREELKAAITDLQCRSMKYNLIFSGLVENNNENTEGVVRDFIYNELQIEREMQFCNVHRFGRRRNSNPRPIVARFLYNSDLVMVRDRAYRLKGKPYSIHEQFPSSVEDRRKKLYPVAKRARQAGRKTRMVRDKLFIDGKLYEESDPPQTDPRSYRDVVNVQPTPNRNRNSLRSAHPTRHSEPKERNSKPAPKRPRAPSTPTSDNHPEADISTQ